MDLWSAGDEVVKFLQRMCSNDIDVPVGHIVITGMQNKWGGYENDCSIARLAENRSDISLFHNLKNKKQNKTELFFTISNTTIFSSRDFRGHGL